MARFSATVINDRIHGLFISPFLKLLPVIDIFRLQKELEIELQQRPSTDKRGNAVIPDRFEISVNSRVYDKYYMRFPVLSRGLIKFLADYVRQERIPCADVKFSVEFAASPNLEAGEVRVRGFFTGTNEVAAGGFSRSWFVYPKGNVTDGRFIDSAGDFIIGRERGCYFEIASAYVTARHAVISCSGDGSLYVADTQSRNGTYVNETRITEIPCILKSGDRIRLGRKSGGTLIVR